jgi:hypothetical protein
MLLQRVRQESFVCNQVEEVVFLSNKTFGLGRGLSFAIAAMCVLKGA